MRNQISRTVAVVLTVSMLLSFASCRQKTPKKEGKFIAADSPWYNSDIIEVTFEGDNSRTLNTLSQKLIGADDKYICIFVDGWYDVADWGKIESNSDYMIKTLLLVDRTTKQTYKSIDLFSVSDFTGFPENVMYANGQIIVKSSIWEEETNDYYGMYYYIDPETESIVDTQEYDYEMNLQAFNSFSIGDYRIESEYNPLVTPVACSLRVIAPDGSITNIDISNPGKSYYEVPVVFALDDNTALIPVAITKGYAYFKLNLTTCELTECDANDYDWLDLDKLIHSYSNTNGEIYYTTETGISKIDIQNETDEEVLDYSWCGVNNLYFTDAEIVECSDDSIVVCGQYASTNMFTSQFVKSCAIVELTKAEENPHAGKQIIELLAADGDINAAVSDAIVEFNNESADYYIEISDRYELSDYTDYSDINSEDDYESALLNASADMSSELAVDIINGEGPDIILNASGLAQLNSDDYLVDLSAYLTDLDEDKYFYNIIEEAKTDDKLYQLPICITLEGIQTDPSYAGSSGVGFTTDEYEEFLDKTLNGSDVIEYGQALYLAKLFNGMNDKFISEGKIDITGSEYTELAEFVKDNVIEMSQSWNDESGEHGSPEEYAMGKNWQTAYYCNCPSISGYLVKRDQIKNGTAILGIPSTDGRGPLFGANISVAVSSQAVDIDACVEFVKILLSDEIQSKLAYSDMLVINRDALTEACNAAIDYYDTDTGSQNVFDYAQGTYVSVQTKFTSEDIDNLFDAIESCSGMSRSDAEISIIIIEEMPPYFLDQKSLDDVVTIIQDRAQKVLDERG